MGATIGVTVMGAIVNHGLPPGVDGTEGLGIHRLPPAAREDLANALRPAFFVAMCASALVFLIAVRWVKEQHLRRSLDEVAAVDAAAGTPATVELEA
jgi:hypothetical protein